MQIPSDLCRYGERVLTGTGLTVDKAVAVAEGGAAAGAPEACVGALRDGWAAALDADHLSDQTSDQAETS